MESLLDNGTRSFSLLTCLVNRHDALALRTITSKLKRIDSKDNDNKKAPIPNRTATDGDIPHFSPVAGKPAFITHPAQHPAQHPARHPAEHPSHTTRGGSATEKNI